jgi:serine phosphatase RsbU (regulator of sigma subunit)
LPVIAVERGGVRLLESTAFPLGMFRDASFTSARLQLCAGDMLFLYTDGVSEAMGQEGEYGIERLVDLVGRVTSSCAAAVVSACLEDLRRFARGAPGLDDLTLLALRYGMSADA